MKDNHFEKDFSHCPLKTCFLYESSVSEEVAYQTATQIPLAALSALCVILHAPKHWYLSAAQLKVNLYLPLLMLS
jgi:hypothetical protein